MNNALYTGLFPASLLACGLAWPAPSPAVDRSPVAQQDRPSPLVADWHKRLAGRQRFATHIATSYDELRPGGGT